MGLKVQGLPLWAIRLSGYLNLGTNREFWGLMAQVVSMGPGSLKPSRTLSGFGLRFGNSGLKVWVWKLGFRF